MVIIKKKNSKLTDNRWLIGGIVIVLFTFILFSPSINYEFVNWDDDVNILENSSVKKLDAEHVKQIFTEHVIGNYNPLSILTFAIEYHFVGESPKLYHLNNLLLHLLCTLLVYILMRRLEISFLTSLIVALLFGIHPMRVESVVWITERKDVLFGAFYLTSLLFYIDFLKKKKNLFFLISIVAFIFSLLSKIQAVSLPFALLLIDYWMNRKPNRKLILEKVPFFALSLATGLIGIYFLRQQESLDVTNIFPLHQRIFIGSYSFVVYLIKSIYPYEMSTLYPYLKKLSLIYYLSIIPSLLIVSIPFFKFKTYKILTFGMFFFVFNIVFLLQIVGAGQGFIADRFTYIPYIGLFFIYASLIQFLLTKYPKSKMLIYSILAFYLIVLTVTTSNRIKVWQNSETLWTDVLEKYQQVPVAFNNLGRYYRIENKLDKALSNYNNAIKYNPEGSVSYNNRGKIFFDTGKIDLALADFDKCLSLDPESTDALANRGAAYGMRKEWQLALNDLTKAIELDPTHTNALKNRGFIYHQLKEYQKNIDDYEKYLELLPNDADIINTIGLCYFRLENFERAIVEYNRSIEINSTKGAFFINRSMANNSLGKKQEALLDALKAKELSYNVNPGYLNFLKQ